MTFTRLFQGQEAAGGNVDRLFFTKSEPQAFRHPLLAHLQHTLHSQLDGDGTNGHINGKQGFNPGGPDYFYTTPHRHSQTWLGGGKSKHHHNNNKSNSTAISALTLLTFLFFLNLLQNCLREQMETMNPTVMVMTAGAAREERLDKSAEQPDGGVGVETEPFFPEERVLTNVSSSKLMRSDYYQPRFEHDASATTTTERSRFQKISVISYSSREASTSPKSVLFRTRF